MQSLAAESARKRRGDRRDKNRTLAASHAAYAQVSYQPPAGRTDHSVLANGLFKECPMMKACVRRKSSASSGSPLLAAE